MHQVGRPHDRVALVRNHVDERFEPRREVPVVLPAAVERGPWRWHAVTPGPEPQWPGLDARRFQGDPDAAHLSSWQRVEEERIDVRGLLGPPGEVERLEGDGPFTEEVGHEADDARMGRERPDWTRHLPRVQQPTRRLGDVEEASQVGAHLIAQLDRDDARRHGPARVLEGRATRSGA